MNADQKKSNILFLCTGNSCRSQMAEGWGRHLHSDKYTFYSAGIEAQGLNGYAVDAMKEAGVDISGQRSKQVKEILDIPFDYVITVCSHADENCPVFPLKTLVMHRGSDDPAKYIKLGRPEEEIRKQFRRVRDEIKKYLTSLPDFLNKAKDSEGMNEQR